MSDLRYASDGQLNGPRKAAALLLMIGNPVAARLLKHFDQPELKVVAKAASELGPISPAALDSLVEEFASDFSAGAQLLGDPDKARELFAEALPPAEVEDLLDSARDEGKEPDVWQALGRAPESAIVKMLEAERPATAVYILSKLDSALAAKIVSGLPRARRNAALCGLMAPREAAPLAAEAIESALREMLKSARKPTGGEESRARIAGILNSLDPDDAEDAMRAIGLASPKEAAILKTMLFSFNDLPKLAERARALLFDRASIDIVVMALRGTDNEFRDVVLSSMPSRGRRLVEGELAAGAQASPREIAKARKAIADIVLGMARRNEIELSGPAVDEAA